MQAFTQEKLKHLLSKITSSPVSYCNAAQLQNYIDRKKIKKITQIRFQGL